MAATIMALTCWELIRAGVSLTRVDLASTWQLVDLPVLERDPLGSVWNLHTQPPLYNLVVGSVLRWSPVPPMGLLFGFALASLVAAALLLTDVLARWRVRPWVAGLIAGISFANPNLLATIGLASYEVPVAFLLTLILWCFQRYLQRPGWGPLLGLSAALTALVMMRSLFHPVFAVAVIALALVARRASARQAVAALAIPVVLAGGWMLKNQVLFGTPTMSSWLGFNLQRGVTATLPRAEVRQAVDDGTVSELALEFPWQNLDQYPSAAGCTPRHDHPALRNPTKQRSGRFVEPNLNDECYLPLYEESQANAIALVRRDPLGYLGTRRQVLLLSFAVGEVGGDGGQVVGTGKAAPTRTWMDQTVGRALLPVHAEVGLDGQNLPILPLDAIEIEVSPVLALLALGVVGRAVLAAWRVLRTGWRERAATWATDELLWVLVGGYVVTVIVIGDLLEFGENGRFRSPLDALLIALPLAGATRWWAER